MGRKWRPLGGCDTNPGVWDVGGAIISVYLSNDGLVRRHHEPYSDQGYEWLVYTAGDVAGDDGGPWIPEGVTEYDTAEEALRERERLLARGTREREARERRSRERS